MDLRSDRGDIESGRGSGFMAAIGVILVFWFLLIALGKCDAFRKPLPAPTPSVSTVGMAWPDCAASNVPCVTRWDDGSWQLVTRGTAKAPLHFTPVTLVATTSNPDGSTWHRVSGPVVVTLGDDAGMGA